MVERILVVITTTSFVMPNFGIKIAKNNYNVESDYEKLIMFSKYPVLKLKSSGTDTSQEGRLFHAALKTRPAGRRR